jgi:hypothetical protein
MRSVRMSIPPMRRISPRSQLMNRSFERLAVLRMPKLTIFAVSRRNSDSLANVASSMVVGHSAAWAAVATQRAIAVMARMRGVRVVDKAASPGRRRGATLVPCLPAIGPSRQCARVR